MRVLLTGTTAILSLAWWLGTASAQPSGQTTVPAPAVTAPAVTAPAAAVPGAAVPPPFQTLATIRSTGHLTCGVVSNADDWNRVDIHGDLSGLGAEVCGAVAIAILGSVEGLTIKTFAAEPDVLAALKAGAIQLAAPVSPDTTIATQYGVGFGPPVYYDSQRLLVARVSGLTQLSDLRDRLICALSLTEPERTLQDEMAARGIPFALGTHSEQGEMDAAVAVRHCAAGTGMESRLAESRANFHAWTNNFDFLPDRLSLEPVVPAYRYGDQIFGLIVDWTIYALIEAEALGITKANVAEAARREDVRAERLLGGDFATAQALGLAHDWAAKVIAGVGNYGEIFTRTVGKPYHLDRGLNRLWTDGGLMRPLPIR